MTKLFGVVALVCFCISPVALANHLGQKCITNSDCGDTSNTCQDAGLGSYWCVNTTVNTDGTAAGENGCTSSVCGASCVDAGPGGGNLNWCIGVTNSGAQQPCNAGPNGNFTGCYPTGKQACSFCLGGAFECNIASYPATHALANTCCVAADAGACSQNNDCCNGTCNTTTHLCSGSPDSNGKPSGSGGVAGFCMSDLDCTSYYGGVAGTFGFCDEYNRYGAPNPLGASVNGGFCNCTPYGYPPAGGTPPVADSCCSGVTAANGNCSCNATSHSCTKNAQCCSGACSGGFCS